ncbi:MAG TPA: MFS transporter [Bacillota bacterium]|nr:MFS transporter [Bacillota bacterium]
MEDQVLAIPNFEAAPERRRMFNRDFVLMWQGAFISYFGDIIYGLAISYWVLQTTGSTALMGTTAALASLPRVLISPFAGALADRLDRKNILALTNLLRGILMFLMAFLTYRNMLSVQLVMFSAFFISAAGVFASPCIVSIIPELVEKEDVVRANSIRSASFSVADLAGNGVGGFLVSILGVPLLILLNAISFIYYYVSLIFVKVPKRILSVEHHQKNLWVDLKEGVIEFFQNIGLRNTLIGFMLGNFFVTGIFSLALALFLQRGYSVEQYGILMSFLGLGAFIGMFAIAFMKIPIKHYLKIITGGFFFMGVCLVSLMFTHNYILSCLLMCLGMIGNSMANAILNSVFILGVVPEKRGKLSGVTSTMSNCLAPVSAIMYGVLGEFISLSLLFGVGITLGVISILIAMMHPKVQEFISLDPMKVASVQDA